MTGRKIVRLDGVPVEQGNPVRDTEIADMLDHFWDMNERGELAALVVCAVGKDCRPHTNWIYNKAPGVTPITVVGAVEVIKAELVANVLENRRERELHDGEPA